jgi:hypothetical protein
MQLLPSEFPYIFLISPLVVLTVYDCAKIVPYPPDLEKHIKCVENFTKHTSLFNLISLSIDFVQEPNKFGCSKGQVFDSENQQCKGQSACALIHCAIL